LCESYHSSQSGISDEERAWGQDKWGMAAGMDEDGNVVENPFKKTKE
jgi:hypothetical protein